MPDATPTRRHGRVWLYAPFALLALLAAGWSGIWGFARSKVDQELDAGIAREARAGRNWTCRERSVGGYPFRIEVRCASLTLTSSRWGDEVKVDAGPAVAVAQVWTPGHIILQMTGPMLANLPQGRKAALDWKEFAASLRLSGLAFERFSLVLDEPVLTVTEPGQAAAETWRASAAEAHLRPNPQRFASDGTVDLAVNARGGVLPALEALIGNGQAADLDLQASLSGAPAFRRGFNPDALEAWRTAGGGLEVARLAVVKGPTRLEATGRIALDETHRPSGRIDAAVAGIDRIAGVKVGGLTAGLGALFGGRAGDGAQGNAAAGLAPLPPIVLREGRVFLGPLRLPLQPLLPLY
ncbi:DUF2125 domain-containing protein [Bosea sp. CS1GBMeth4]|uniref:DUF2125 domain-containing protein n=1 Tax=Bosea sp. CS1GBMeth4 TaxID=1892849 RepID=UPI001645B4D7|nr:DUF2125 domain-containing protein [Bosea sp. CS1GBMeth4]